MSTVFEILNALGLGGLAVFIFFVFRSLGEKVSALQATVEEQNRTLKAARERAEELDRLRKHYKEAMADFQDLGAKIEQRRKLLISELETESERKDEELAKLKRIELEQIELAKASLEAMPRLRAQLDELLGDMRTQWQVLTAATRSLPRSTYPINSPLAELLKRGDIWASPGGGAIEFDPDFLSNQYIVFDAGPRLSPKPEEIVFGSDQDEDDKAEAEQPESK